jgi:hypothetical protein
MTIESNENFLAHAIAVLQAVQNGETLEYRSLHDRNEIWVRLSIDNVEMFRPNFMVYDYRVVAEPRRIFVFESVRGGETEIEEYKIFFSRDEALAALNYDGFAKGTKRRIVEFVEVT